MVGRRRGWEQDMNESAVATALGGAGLRFVRMVDVSDPLIPPTLGSFATSLSAGDLTSAESISFDERNLWEKANSAWLRIARDGALFEQSRPTFLVAVRTADDGPASDFWWAEVELQDRWDVIGKDGSAASGVLGAGAERPGFVMLSTDGRVLFRVDSGETTIDLILVRDPERVTLLREHGLWMAQWRGTTEFNRAALQRWLARTGVE
jgi:hypothetical protein